MKMEAGPSLPGGSIGMAQESRIVSVVDDDSEVRGSIANFLRSAAMQVASFDSAENFLTAPERVETQCLVTDLHMPGMDGLELQEELLRQQSMIPLIMMTAYPSSQARDQALANGAVAFLGKPVDPDMLLDEIERAIASAEPGAKGESHGG